MEKKKQGFLQLSFSSLFTQCTEKKRTSCNKLLATYNRQFLFVRIIVPKFRLRRKQKKLKEEDLSAAGNAF